MWVLQEMQKTQWLYGNYMRVLQGMFKKPSGYYGTYMRVLQEMQKTQWLLWDLYAGIARDAKNPVAIWELYAGIVRNV
jgi:hypothetical protein